MSRDKQIEEMAKDFCAVGIPCEECHLYKNRCHAKKYATRAYNAGYRKASECEKEIADWKAISEQYRKQFEDCYEEKTKIASEVAREIFNVIFEQVLTPEGIDYPLFAELEKKYTEEGK